MGRLLKDKNQTVWYAGAVGEEERCPDCGAKAGGFHHFGCDIENCPVCHGQMLLYKIRKKREDIRR